MIFPRFLVLEVPKTRRVLWEGSLRVGDGSQGPPVLWAGRRVLSFPCKGPGQVSQDCLPSRNLAQSAKGL